MTVRRITDGDADAPLIIDRSAAAEVPPLTELRDWARDKRIFVSSVMSDLSAERKAAASAIRSFGARPVMFEEFGGREADAEDAYLGEVETSDVYLGILGLRYGKPLRNTGYSPTHTEYLHAKERGLRLALWTLQTEGREGHQQSFLDEVRVWHTVPEFSTPDELGRQIEERLVTLAAEDLSPWCKLGNVVFRAREVTSKADNVTVLARIRTDEAAHALEEVTRNTWRDRDSTRFTTSGRSLHVRVLDVQSSVTSSRTRTLTIIMEPVEPRGDRWEVSIGKYSPDDQTEISLRHTLFGESNPFADQHINLFAELPDPLQLLRDARVPEEIIRPLAELMLVDSLVGSGRASRVVDVVLGAATRGKRRLTLIWETPLRYSNERTKRRSIEGDVRL